MNTIGIVVSDGIGNQLFKIFATISYYIDHAQNYILYTTATPMDIASIYHYAFQQLVHCQFYYLKY